MKNTKKVKKKSNNRLLCRFCFCTLIFGILFFMGIEFIIASLDINHTENLIFKEQGNVKYSVCLKQNDFFDEECLEPNMSYVASLIKNIPLEFNYQFNGNLDNLVNSVDYEVIAKLIIKNSETAARYFEKEYVLVSKTSDTLKDANTLYNLNKKVDLDYEYYNNIATSFKSQYGVDSQSYLEVFLNTYNNTNEEYKDIPTSGKILVQIPLSQKALEIKFNTQEINKDIEKVITSKYFNITNWFRLIIGVILLLIAFFFLYLMIEIIKKLNKSASKYDKYIAKILKEYDRLIAETSTMPSLDDYEVLIINSFNELVDVRDNLRLPIMFYSFKDSEKAYFYIIHQNNLYLYEISTADISKGDKK